MGVSRVYKVGTPYNLSELGGIDYAQSFDTMYLTHIDHPVTKLTRADHTDWLFSTVAFGPTIDPPTGVAVAETTDNEDAANSGNAYFPQTAKYCVSSVDEDSGQESRASTAVSAFNDLGLKRNKNTISWDAVDGASLYRVYKADNTGAFGLIIETDQLSAIDDNILQDQSDSPVVGFNPFAAAGDYPSSVCFFEQRLFFGRTRNIPNSIYGSRSADFENMDKARPLKADDSLAIAVTSGKVNAVNQLVPAHNLLALTSDSVFEITGANDDYLSPSPPPKVRRQNGRGASSLKGLLIDSVTFFQPDIGSEVRTLGYSFQIDGLESNDVSIFSPHFFKGRRIVSWAYAKEPLSVVWAVMDDGGMLAFTWQSEQQVWGWTEMEIDGFVRSVCVVPEGGEDRVYLIVKRTIGGVDRYYIEQMDSAKWLDFHDACYLDCAVSYGFDAATATITHLDHLEGKEVWALADGFVIKGLTVTGGAVTLPDTVTNATIGLPMTATAETLPLLAQRPDGAMIGTKQTTGLAHLRLVETLGITAGRSDDHQEDVSTRTNEPLGQQADLYTGVVRVQMQQAVAYETTVVIKQANPLPMRLTAAYVEIDASR